MSSHTYPISETLHIYTRFRGPPNNPRARGALILNSTLTVLPTVLDTFSQVFFSRKTALFVNAEHICSTPLKLCRHLDISATAAHFSMAATRPLKLARRSISDATNRETSLKRLVISNMWGALLVLSVFIHAWPKNSLSQKNKWRKTRFLQI